MTDLAFTRIGSGEPLVLLHGIGSSRRVWDPVVAALAERFDVCAVDLPGFGDSAPLPRQVGSGARALAASVGRLIDDLGLGVPHVVGNSLGGWVALELAGSRRVRSLTLLSPAGLWRDRTPAYTGVSLRASRWLSQHAGDLLAALVAGRTGRLLILGQTHGRPWRMTAEQARRTIADVGGCVGFDATLAATSACRYRAGVPIEAPVTVAFGSRDLILLARRSRHLDQLPAGTLVRTLPGCGHVPMFDDPAAVTDLIIASATRGSVDRFDRAIDPVTT